MTAAKNFDYGGKSYVLWVAKDASSGQAQVKVAEASGKMIGVLTAASFDNTVVAQATQHIQTLINAAKTLVTATKAGPPTAQTMTNLKNLQMAVFDAEELVKNDILANACKVLNAGCFAAGTKLWTPGGYRKVEEIRRGEAVYSRSEFDPAGEIEAKVVEEIFHRYAVVLHLHVGGRVIRTTGEHPFYVHEKGWQKAGDLQAGDWVLTAEGKWVPVEELYDTGEWEVVYNLRVAEYHTYFVGDDGWGFAVWAHNAYMHRADQSLKIIGEEYVRRALYWRNTLPPANQSGVTVAVSKYLGQEIVSLYANDGNVGAQVPMSVILAFQTRVEQSGGVFIWAHGQHHAEQALFITYSSVNAIGISNPGGLCKTICVPFFIGRDFFNIWYPPIS